MKKPGDKRTNHAIRDDEAVAELKGIRGPWLDMHLDLARLHHRLDKDHAFAYARAAQSVEMLASLEGYSGYFARDLTHLGYALDAEPRLEPLLREKEIGFVQACRLGELHRSDHLARKYGHDTRSNGEPNEDAMAVREGDHDWVMQARLQTPAGLTKMVKSRLAEVREALPDTKAGKAPRKPYGASVTEETAEDLARCQALATQRAKRALTRAQTLAAVAKTYLHDVDPLEQVPPRRTMPHTALRLDDRGIPEEVTHELMTRSGGYCEFGICERMAAERCHLEPHADGSPREARDLVLGCKRHHTAFDDGDIRFLTWTPDGRPVFIVDGQNEIMEPKPRPDPAQAREYPKWLEQAMGPSARRKRKKMLAGLAAESAAEAADASQAADDSEPGDAPRDGETPRDDGSGLVMDRAVLPRDLRAPPVCRRARAWVERARLDEDRRRQRARMQAELARHGPIGGWGPEPFADRKASERGSPGRGGSGRGPPG